jgi:hypothetical protein
LLQGEGDLLFRVPGLFHRQAPPRVNKPARKLSRWPDQFSGVGSLVNASDALRGVIERHQAKLREAARLCAAKGKAPAAPSKPPRPEAEAPATRRRAHFDAVIRLHAQGMPIKRIARRTGVARNAVRLWLRAGEHVPYRRARTEPAGSASPFRRGSLARGPAQQRRTLARLAVPRIRGRLRHRPALGQATPRGRGA